MIRTELNIATGEVREINTCAYVVNDTVVLIDEGELVPEGAVPAAAVQPRVPSVPATIYKWQAIYELNAQGLWSTVQAYINAPDTPWETKIAWENIHELERNNPLIATFAAKMSWTQQFLDDFFIAAAKWQIK